MQFLEDMFSRSNHVLSMQDHHWDDYNKYTGLKRDGTNDCERSKKRGNEINSQNSNELKTSTDALSKANNSLQQQLDELSSKVNQILEDNKSKDLIIKNFFVSE